MDKNFVGNQPAYELIANHVARREPGPMILQGSCGLGKLFAAKAAASALLCTPIDRLGLHSDYFLLDKANDVIKVEDIQVLLERSSVSSVSGRKVFIIRNAENMNVQSQNKLLKLLEDRNRTNQMILTCNRGLLLDTIISRCNVIPFYSLPYKEMEEYLECLGVEPEGVHLAAYLCEYGPYNWEGTASCYGDLRTVYLKLLGMKKKEDIFWVLHLFLEKDPKSFYEVHSKHLLAGLQMLQYIFYHMTLLKLGDNLPELVEAELAGLARLYSLPQAFAACAMIEKHKYMAVQKYTKNDFFDLVRCLV